ncbi:choline ABC transporter substrate-binding protein [Rhizobium sp. RAF36]|uniref:choline ABC transporter substrate-binding protein n=1 Tax=Rhizobium sp. RAF36 TaxID=3233055 RepID=UPI003F9C34D6
MRTKIAAMFFAILGCSSAHAQDAPECKKVRIADLGWTDIMLTNNTAEFILDALGYEATQTLLGMDVTYMSLKNGEMDVFQGNWRPFQDAQYKPFFDQRSVEVLGTNLEGAKFTLAVPKYVADAGIKDFGDLASHGDQFEKQIYALEPGSNTVLLDMIAANRHELGQWKVVESSEAGMLTQVKRAIARKQWIVFLGWEPHPMNLDYDMSYLTGGDVEFGPNFGGATVRTIARKGYAKACPNVAKLFSNLVFNLEYENHGMQMIIDQGQDAPVAAREMMRLNPQMLDKWLAGVTTFDGKPALPVIKGALGS